MATNKKDTWCTEEFEKAARKHLEMYTNELESLTKSLKKVVESWTNGNK